MYKTSSTFRVSCFHHRVFIWTLLAVFSCSFAPSTSFAQQPTATIKTLSGDVLVSGQAATVGTILQAGGTIQTQAGASVALELSDGTEIHLGEKTQITFAELTQTTTGARVSSLTLHAGRVRAFLSQKHQQEGSAFTVETSNARIDATFSEPDVEVSYSLEKAETVGIAHSVRLLAKNLVTNKEVSVPVGSTVVITNEATKVIAGMIASAESTGTSATGTALVATESTEMGTSTKVAIGVGAAAAAGGVAAVAAGSGDGNGTTGSDSSNPFTGTFRAEWTKTTGAEETVQDINIVELVQNGTSLTGTITEIDDVEGCCAATSTIPITGTVNGNSATFSAPGMSLSCVGANGCTYIGPSSGVATATVTLSDDGNILYLLDPGGAGTIPFYRQ